MLRIERSMAGLGRLGGWVDGIVVALHLEPKAEYALRLCLEEAAANVVMHGGTDGAAAESAAVGAASWGGARLQVAASAADGDVIMLRVMPEAATLRITVEDRCRAFDPLTVPPPVAPARLEDAQIGGLGIHLMRQYASSIRYERVGAVNRLSLTIRRAA